MAVDRNVGPASIQMLCEVTRLSNMRSAEEETTQTDPRATSHQQAGEKEPHLLFIEHQ